MTAYGEDLAYIHDAGYGKIARGAARRIVTELARRGLRRGTIVDLGCGSGILAEQVSHAGFDVLGIDISPAMVALAQRRAPLGRFECGSVHAAELPPCVAVACTGEVLNYEFDPTGSPETLLRLFHRTYEALEQNGILLLDAAEPARRRAGPQQRFTLGEDWATLVERCDDPEPGLLIRRIISFRSDGTAYRRSEELHRQRLYRRSELAAMLRIAGFRIRFLAGYADDLFPIGIFGIQAWRR